MGDAYITVDVQLVDAHAFPFFDVDAIHLIHSCFVFYTMLFIFFTNARTSNICNLLLPILTTKNKLLVNDALITPTYISL